MTQALDGIRVIELGEGVSAAYCARLFADFGADVVKIEDPHGDVARAWGPFPGDTPDPEKSGLFVFLNTNKRGIALDLASQDGRAALQRLLAGADLLVENLPLERARELGLDGDALQRAHPELVHVALSPFGRSGPYAGWKGYDLNAYHLTAAGHRYCGRPGEAPLEHGTFSAEFFGAAAAAAWGLAAVLGRARVGGGQQLDVSCAEAIAAVFVGGQNIGALAQDGKWEHRTGVGMPLGAPATILPCRDGHVWMLALEAGQWNGLRRVMGDPDWAQAEMFQDMFARAQNADLIYPLLEEWTLQHGKWEIMERCQAEGVPVTAVFSVQEAAEQPHLRARRHFVDIEHPKLGRVRHLGAPFRLPASPGGPARPAPGLGQHTREVLAQPPAAKRSAAPPPPAPSARALPLEGLRVANFGWVWAGPVVGQTLGFLGADVVKIESRTRIDLTRTLPPFGGGIRDPDRSLSNHACWAGNGSVTLDLKQPEAQALARRLVARCDVVIENFGPGVMEQLQLGWDELRAVRPDLVMFSMPAAGLDGPLKDIRTYGLSLTSTTGLDSLTGYVDGPPIPVENAFSDPYNGILGAYAILVALAHRDRTGAGQHIDYSQQEAVMQMIGPAYMDYVLNGRVAGPLGNRHPLAAGAPHGVFPCAGDDRWISIAVLQDEEWRGLVRAMGDPEWACANDLATAAARVQRSDEIHERLAAWTREQDAGALTARLQQHGVAAAPVLSVADLLSDPHWRARKTFIEVVHPLGFPETIYGAYVKTSRSHVDVQPGPRMGQDNERVLRDLLGLGADEYQRLLDARIIH
ncbi:CoA transferase [Myxococcota bacterium]|nr:CoA transferase [Myxococcota bacterium]